MTPAQRCRAARELSWAAGQGRRMTLNLERGFNTGVDLAAFAQGLGRLKLGEEIYSDTFRDHDKPGF